MILFCSTPAAAQQAPAPDLKQASIEELMQMQVTSVGRKAQRVEDTPAAVYVITSDDIHRSGIRTLPELFRLAPGLQVAMINSNHWAISIRGFNGAAPGDPVRTDGHGSYQSGTAFGRWTHAGEGGSSLLVQSAVTILRSADLINEQDNAFETDLEYHKKLTARHDVVVGGGYRYLHNTIEPSFQFVMTPPTRQTSTTSIFAQDEIAITESVRLTLGAKLEHHTVAGWGTQPTARVLWQPASRHRLWAATSRALRTLSRIDQDVRLRFAAIEAHPLPILLGRLGNPDYQTEVFTDVEAGYRFELATSLSFDATAFRGRSTGLPTNEPQAPVFEATPGPPHLYIATRPENRMRADTSGIELAAHAAVLKTWRLDASYSRFALTPHIDAASQDPLAASFDGNAPAHQWQVHSALWLGARTEIDASLFYVGRLRASDVPAYTRADVRAQVKLTERLSAAVVGRNLSQARHAEYADQGVVVATLVPRGADLHLMWRFGR